MKIDPGDHSITNPSGNKNENQNRRFLKSMRMRNIDVLKRFFEKISNGNPATFSSLMILIFNLVSVLNYISSFKSVRE